jgi:hypothetical protein
MWRLEDTTAGNSFYIQLEIQNSTHYVFLYYYLCGMGGVTNGTNYVYFNATGADTIGTWTQLHRDLWHDYEAAGFGSLSSSHYIKELRIYGESAGGGRLELLLDDFYIYDDPAPTITNVENNPDPPNHYDPSIVTCDAEDQDLDTVLLHYRTDGGGWQDVTMTPTASYAGQLPGQPYDTTVEYYVTANDTWGKTTTDDNNGAYYSYTVADETPPDYSDVYHSPVPPTYLDQVTVFANLTDYESGVVSAMLYYQVDGGVWIPASFTHYTGDRWRGFIDAQPYQSEVQYYIYVQNNAGGSDQTPNYIYVVNDLTSPSIVFYSPVSGDTVSGNAVAVNVTGNDGAGSGIAYIELYINDVLVANQSSASYIYTWDTLDGSYPNDLYQLRAVAYDEVGNSATTHINATVNNFIPYPILPILIGAIIVVVIVVVVVIAVWFFRFRPAK